MPFILEKKKSHTQYSIFHINVRIPGLFFKKYLKYVVSVHLLHEIWNLKKQTKKHESTIKLLVQIYFKKLKLYSFVR